MRLVEILKCFAILFQSSANKRLSFSPPLALGDANADDNDQLQVVDMLYSPLGIREDLARPLFIFKIFYKRR